MAGLRYYLPGELSTSPARIGYNRPPCSIPVDSAVEMEVDQYMAQLGQAARAASREVARSSTAARNNALLAARAHGLCGVLTTFLSREESAASEFLHLPEHHALAAVLFLGYPVHQPTKLRRSPVRSFATVDTFDGAPFGTAAD